MNRRDALMDRRVQVGHTQESLAFALGVAPSTVSAWERGMRNPSPRQRPALAELLGVGVDGLNRLLNPDTPAGVNGHEVLAWLTHYESLIHSAGALGKVELVAIPALLQTKLYIESAERSSGLPLSEGQIQAVSDMRLARQAVLDRSPDPLQLSVLLGETALRESVGAPGVMIDQLDHLVAAAERSNVDLRLLRPGQGLVAVSGFELLTRSDGRYPFLACTVDVGGVRYHEDPDVVRKFADRFAYLLDAALPPHDTLKRIHQIRETHRQ